MNVPSVAAAVYNNALWCEAVCRAHGLPTQIDATLWCCLRTAPRFYPNVVTLDPGALRAQMARVDALLQSDLPGMWGVKDSYAALDLTPRGFAPLFDAQWIARPARPFLETMSGLRWMVVRTAAELAAWESAWEEGEGTGLSRLFAPALLDNPDIFFLAGRRDNRLLTGGILNRTRTNEGIVVGISNTFAAAGADARACWEDVVAQAARFTPGCPIVGYEAGEPLGWAVDAGFAELHPLRIWARRTTI